DQRLGGAEFSRNGTSLAPPGSTRERLRKLSGSDVEGLQETKGMGYSNRRQSSMLLGPPLCVRWIWSHVTMVIRCADGEPSPPCVKYLVFLFWGRGAPQSSFFGGACSC